MICAHPARVCVSPNDCAPTLCAEYNRCGEVQPIAPRRSVRRASRVISKRELKAVQHPEGLLMDAFTSLVHSLGPLDGHLTITVQLEDAPSSIPETRAAFRATEA